MFSSLDISIIRKIQEDLPLVAEPYRAIAEELQITESELISKIQEFCNKGIIRRFGATLNHRNIGFKANAMVVWQVPEERIKEVSKIMILFSAVSHCYQRPTFSNWPYNMFTMVHGETKCYGSYQFAALTSRISAANPFKKYRRFFITKCLRLK